MSTLSALAYQWMKWCAICGNRSEQQTWAEPVVPIGGRGISGRGGATFGRQKPIRWGHQILSQAASILGGGGGGEAPFLDFGGAPWTFQVEL